MAQIIDFTSRNVLADEPSSVETDWNMEFYDDPKNTAMVRCEFYVNQRASIDLQNAFFASLSKQANELMDKQRS